MRTPYYASAVIGAALLLAGGSGSASTVPFSDGFEDYPVGTTFLTPVNGWGATTNSVQVQTNTAGEGTKAVVLPGQGTLSNGVAGAALQRLWVDQLVLPCRGDPPLAAAGSDESIRLFFNTNGYISVATAAGWDECSTDVFGVAVAPVSNAWVRVSLLLDFSNRVAAMVLRGQLLREQVPFIGSGASSFSQVCYRNDSDPVRAPTNAYVDGVLITTNLPGGLEAGADGDNDGMSDAEEVYRYGTVTVYKRPVISTTVSTTGSPAGEGGTVTPVGPFDVFPGSSTNFVASAYPAFIVTAILTNGVSVGAFAGQNTRSASYTYANIRTDSVVTVAFTYTGLRYVPSEYATIGEATAAAHSNEVIRVADGTYVASAPIVAAVPLTILGNTNNPAAVVVNAPASGVDRDCFQVRASDVTIEGFRMVGAVNFGDPASNGWLNAGIMVGNDAGFRQMAVATAFGGITNGAFDFNEMSNCSHGVYLLNTTNCVVRQGAPAGNTTGVWANVEADARLNWWGSITGPSGVGPGSGDAVSSNVLYEPWLAGRGSAQLVYCVFPGESLQQALDGARACDYILVVGGTYTETITVSNSLTLLGNAFTVAGTLHFNGSSTLTATNRITVDAVTVDAGATVILSQGDLVAGTLTIGAGGSLIVSNGFLDVNGLVLSGTFTLNDGWNQGLIAQPIRYSEDFELYPAGMSIGRLGYFGLAGSSSNVVVQASEVNGGSRALVMPMRTSVTNEIHASANRIWTDIYVMPTLGIEPETYPSNDVSLAFYFTSSGHVAIARTGGWDTCSSDAFGVPVNAVSNTWARLTWVHDYRSGRAALMMNGRLLRYDIPFVDAAVSNYNEVVYNNVSGPSLSRPSAYVDDIVVDTALPPNLSDDGNHDGMADAEELYRFWDLETWKKAGSIFTFR